MEPRRIPVALWVWMVLVAGCRSGSSLPRGCESALIAAPSASVVHLADSTPPRLPVSVTTSFPEHKALSGARVWLYTDTLESRVRSPLRSGVTDASGVVSLEPLPAGRYGLRSSAGNDSFFSIVALRGTAPDSLEVRLVTQSHICY